MIRPRRRHAPMATINVTPMVDVMLVLLIIFMVTAPLLVAGVPVNLPDARSKSLDQNKKPVAISLDRSGRVFIDDTEVSAADLPRTLEQIAVAKGAEGQVFLRADGALGYAKVMRVMGELNRAGLNRVALVTSGSDPK